MTASHCRETASDMRLVHTWFACNTHHYIKNNIYSIKKRWGICEKVHRIIIHTYCTTDHAWTNKDKARGLG